MTRTFKRIMAAAALVTAILGSTGAAGADEVCLRAWTTMPTEIETTIVCADLP